MAHLSGPDIESTSRDARSGAKSTPADVTNAPRNIAFVRQAPSRHWLNNDPVGTAVFNALSLTFPEGERFFIDSVKQCRDGIEGKLAQDVRDFITQESLHTREHAAFNGLIDADHYPVAQIQAMVKARTDNGRMAGPRVMLLITIALEHFTAILADDALKNKDAFPATEETVKRMWHWHALEETEHKAVAFDVFQNFASRYSKFRRYMMRTQAMAIVTTMFILNITTYALMLMKADGITGLNARWKLYNYLFGKPGLFRRVAGTYFDWYRPGFHPWDHDNRALLNEWRPRFDVASPALAAE